jgi:hypothetical protein
MTLFSERHISNRYLDQAGDNAFFRKLTQKHILQLTGVKFKLR